LAIAKDAKFKISANDLTELQAELEDNELENTAGGGGSPSRSREFPDASRR